MAIPQLAARAATVAAPLVKKGAAQVLSSQASKRGAKGKCVPCFSSSVKAAIRTVVRDPDVLQVLDSLPDCQGGMPFNICARIKRSPSEYQAFISDCMKAKNIKGFGNAAPAMKECAAEWRRQKGQ